MSLPPRSFHSITEVAIRWSVTPFDVVGWCTEGLLALSIALPPVKTGPSEAISGLVDVDGAHVLPLFRRDGAPSATVAIRWVRDQSRECRWITEPSDGVLITAADVLVKRVEVERFEKEHGLFGGQRPADARHSRNQHRRGGPGVPPRYDWDRFYGALARRIHDQGIPATQAELVREMLDWFLARDPSESPDESTVRRRVAQIWRELVG